MEAGAAQESTWNEEGGDNGDVGAVGGESASSSTWSMGSERAAGAPLVLGVRSSGVGTADGEEGGVDDRKKDDEDDDHRESKGNGEPCEDGEETETADRGIQDTTSDGTDSHADAPEVRMTDGSSRAIVFTHASPDQVWSLYCHKADFFSAPFTLGEYLDMARCVGPELREDEERAFFVLHPHGWPSDILCSCVVHLRDAIISTSNGAVRRKAAVVAELFTEPACRRQGLAKYLLRRVQQTMDELEEEVQFSVVWSPGFTRLYRELGWHPQPATVLRILLRATKPPGMPPGLPPTVEALDRDDHASLAEMDANLSLLRLSAKRDRTTHAQFEVTRRLLLRQGLHFASRWRTLTRCGAEMRPRQSPDAAFPGRWGAAVPQQKSPVCGGARGAYRALGWWHHDFVGQRLLLGRLLKLRARGQAGDVLEVLRAGVEEALSWELRELVVWQPDEDTAQAARTLGEELGLEVAAGERREMVPCLRWREGAEGDVELVDAMPYAAAW